MCGDCGCQEANKSFFPEEIVDIKEDILKKNNFFAHENYHWFEDHKVISLNLMSSPGAGKTSLLEETLKDSSLCDQSYVFIGDQQTERDADRLKKIGAGAKQINTFSSCHLNAEMIQRELQNFTHEDINFIFIENVGNLVCPSAFDLGESIKVALLSTTEGEDKPLKYPVLFHQANIILLTKIDLIPYLNWNYSFAIECIKRVNPSAKIIPLSTKSGEGMDLWISYLKSLRISQSFSSVSDIS